MAVCLLPGGLALHASSAHLLTPTLRHRSIHPQLCWQMKQLRREVAELLRAGKQGNARIRWVSTALDCRNQRQGAPLAEAGCMLHHHATIH